MMKITLPTEMNGKSFEITIERPVMEPTISLLGIRKK